MALACWLLATGLACGCDVLEGSGRATRDDGGPRTDGGAGGEPALLTGVEDDLLTLINEERSASGLPRLVRDPGLDRVMQWHVAGMTEAHRLGHDDRNGRRGEERARYYGGDPSVRCTEIIQWWGGTPSGETHYRGYYDSPEHHDAYMETGPYDLGPTSHAGVGALSGTGPTGSAYEGRPGSYTGVLLCDQTLSLAIDPFSEP